MPETLPGFRLWRRAQSAEFPCPKPAAREVWLRVPARQRAAARGASVRDARHFARTAVLIHHQMRDAAALVPEELDLCIHIIEEELRFRLGEKIVRPLAAQLGREVAILEPDRV